MNREEMQRINYENNHKEIDGVLYKKCSIHKDYFSDEDEWMLCDTEYFYKNKSNTKDGLSPYCKRCTSKKSGKYQIDNREHYLEYKRNEHKIKYAPDKREYFREVSRRNRASGKYLEWERNNPEKLKKYREYRELHKTHIITKKEWELCKEYFNNQCAYCGVPIEEHFNKFAGEMRWTDFHKEHVNHEGSNDLSNCIPSCKICNSSKHTEGLEMWYTKDKEFYSEERLGKIYKWIN